MTSLKKKVFTVGLIFATVITSSAQLHRVAARQLRLRRRTLRSTSRPTRISKASKIFKPSNLPPLYMSISMSFDFGEGVSAGGSELDE